MKTLPGFTGYAPRPGHEFKWRNSSVKKTPNPIDKAVGARVRMRRMMLGMSQEKLGDAVKLTFQQVQKYEKGTNRMGASRLQQFAGILQVPVAWFFEGTEAGTPAMTIESDPVRDFMTSTTGIRIAKAWPKVTDGTRRRLADLVDEVANVGE